MQYVAPVAAGWRTLSRRTRGWICAGAGAVAIAAVVASLVARAPQSALFATPLHPEQLAEVQERLAGWNVAFTPGPDNVTVDAGRRSDLLLRLSLAGVPHAHLQTTGEALANVGVLTPQAVIDAQTRAGLAGDIEDGLRGIEGVDDARVIVAAAKPAEFADDSQRNASASVRLRMRAGSELSRAAVSGIRAFVAASVPGLRADAVTIVDDRGVALGVPSAGDDAAQLQQSLQAALDAAFGEGAAIVRVRAEYRDDRISERDVRREPLGPEPIARAAHDESFSDGAKRYQRADRTDDRGSQTREIVSETPAGTVRRISAAVFVDRTRAGELDAVRELAAATIGYDARRGDTLVVQSVDFHRSPAARKDPWWLLYGAIVPLGPALALAAGIALAARYALPPLTALLRGALERAAVTRASNAVAGFEPARVRSVLDREPPHAAAAVISALPAATAAAVLDLYPPHERADIVARMQRPNSPVLGDPQELLRRRA